MRAFIALGLVLALCGCSKLLSPGCSKDTDCKGDRVCQAGQCVPPPAAVAPLVVPPPIPTIATPPRVSSAAPIIGEPVPVDDSLWTVLDIKDLGKAISATADYASGEKKTTSGKFVQVHYRVMNNGKKQQTLLDAPKMTDGRGREFGAMSGETEYVPKGTRTAILETLQPAVEKDFYTIIEVPGDATSLKIQVTGLGLLGTKKMIESGL